MDKRSIILIDIYNDYITLIIIDVTVSISGISPREVNESSGSVQVCIEADHESREPYSINLRTSADTAIGECGNVT